MFFFKRKPSPIPHSLDVPVVADSVLSPTLVYNDESLGTYMYFPTNDESGYGRVVFDSLDSIKISRGEYFPFDDKNLNYNCNEWVYSIEHSPWQLERYSYERKYYQNSYNFGGNVDEMIEDFRHFVFVFHDEFVECIARGFWVESSNEPFSNMSLTNQHPLTNLEKLCETHQLTNHDLVVSVRVNSKSKILLQTDAQLCRQAIIQYHLTVEDHQSLLATLYLQYRKGSLLYIFVGNFGQEYVSFKTRPLQSEVDQLVIEQIQEIYKRRLNMGKYKQT